MACDAQSSDQRPRTSLQVGGVRLRPIRPARDLVEANLAAAPVKAAAVAAGLRAAAALYAAPTLARDHAAGLFARATLVAIVAKAPAVEAAESLLEAALAATIAKQTAHPVVESITADLALRVERAGYTRVTSAGDRRVTSSGDVRVVVQVSAA